MGDSAFPHELSSVERTAVVAQLQRLKTSASLEQYKRVFELSLEGRPPLFVKFGDFDLLAEAAAQTFFHALSKTDGSTPRVPKIFNVFKAEKSHYCIVMEKADAKPLDSCGLSEEQSVQIAASAVRWLHEQLPAVPDSVFGAFGRTTAKKVSPSMMVSAWHPFFKDHRGPGAAFADSASLTSYISKCCRPKANRLSVDAVLGLFGDHRRVCHSDIKHENFLFNANSGEVWIVDFEHVAVLPEVFQTYAFFNIGLSFAAQYQSND